MTAAHGTKTRRANVADVVETIRERILAGFYPAGHHLRETAVATDLNVSRTPVREAFQRLAADGLVDLHPNRGARVTDFSDEELDEIFSLRVLLEGYGARLAAERIDDETLERLVALEKVMEKSAQRGDATGRETVAAINTQFHLLILETSGNERLNALVAPLVRVVVTSMFKKYEESDVERSLFHHKQLLAAVRARDGEWAEAVMKAHLLSARHVVHE